MDKIPLAALVLQGFPENFVLILFGFTVFNIKRKVSCIALMAVVHTITAYFIRLLPLRFGIHSILLVLLLALYIHLLAKVDIFKSFAASLTNFIALTFAESLVIWVIIDRLNLSYEAIFATPSDRIKFGLLSPAMILTLTGMLMVIKKWVGHPRNARF